MLIGYESSKLDKICNLVKNAKKHLPGNISEKLLFQRMEQLEAFDTLADVPGKEVPPLHFHELHQDKVGLFSVTLHGTWRIVFRPPTKKKKGDEYDLSTITEIIIMYVGDYHKWS